MKTSYGTLDVQRARSSYLPLLKSEWVEMGDPAPLCRRTHGGAGARALALVKPLPPKAVAGRPGFTRAKRPRLQSPPADRWAAIQNLALARSLLLGATSPIRNSKEPKLLLSDVRDNSLLGTGSLAHPLWHCSGFIRGEASPTAENFDLGGEYVRVGRSSSWNRALAKQRSDLQRQP